MASIQSSGISTNGSVFLTQRTETIEKILCELNSSNVLLIRAPFASGKTSLATLLHEHLLDMNITAMLLPLWGLRDDDILRAEWVASTGHPMNHWFQGRDDQERFIILDDLQEAYDNPQSVLWEYLQVAQSMDYPHVKVVCFALYGENTRDGSLGLPFTFNTIRGIELLRLTPSEAKELLQDFNLRNSRKFVLSVSFQEQLMRMTGGHVGFLIWIFEQILLCNVITDEPSLAAFLVSREFVESLNSHRLVPQFRAMSEPQRQICRHIVLNGSYILPQSNDGELEIGGDVNDLLTMGLCRVENRLEFSCPLVLHLAAQFLFHANQSNYINSR